MRVTNIHPKRPNRSAWVIAEYDGMVLYDAIEGEKVFAPNMIRSSDKFWAEHAAH